MAMPFVVVGIVVFVIGFGCIDLRIFSQDGWCVYVGFLAHQHSKSLLIVPKILLILVIRQIIGSYKT